MNISPSTIPSQPQQSAEQSQAQQTSTAVPKAKGWPLPNEITLKILGFVGDEPVTRDKMRGVSKWFEQFVNDNSFWRSFAPFPDSIPSENQRRSDALTYGSTGVSMTARTPRRLETVPPMPLKAEECATTFRATVTSLSPRERQVVKALLTHAPGATGFAKEAMAQNRALQEMPVFMAAALQHDHIFARYGSHLFAGISGYGQFLSIQAGVAYGFTGNKDAAEATLRTSLRKNPGLLAAQFLLGSILQEQGKKDAALAVFDDLIAKRPDYGSAHYSRGVLCYEQGRDTEALRHFDSVDKVQPDLVGAKLMRGRILLDQEQFQEAARAFSDYRRVVFSHSEAAASEALAQHRLNNNNIALEICNTFLDEFPQDVAVHFCRGNIHLHLSAISVEALADYDAVLAVLPQHETAIANRNRVLSNRETLRIGLEKFDRASATGDDLGEAYVDRAVLYYQVREYSRSQADCVQASSLCDSTKLILLQAAVSLQLGRPDMAAQYHAVAVEDGAEAYSAACAEIWPNGEIPTFPALY